MPATLIGWRVFLEPRGQDQSVTAGQRSTVTGTGHRAFPGPSGRGLLRRVGRVIEARQPQPLDAQHPAHGHLGVPLQQHLQPGRQVGPEPAITQHAQHRRAAVASARPVAAAAQRGQG